LNLDSGETLKRQGREYFDFRNPYTLPIV
jgi:hypothetical protein